MLHEANEMVIARSDQVVRTLRRLEELNRKIGVPEFCRGLHYWLGFEYAIALPLLDLGPGRRVLDIGTGAFSTFPYLLAGFLGTEVTALDVAPSIARQAEVRDRAARSGLCRRDQVRIVRADARGLPFGDGSFDGFTAISSLEHVEGEAGDRVALREAARVLRQGGIGITTVPFRAEGSVEELSSDLTVYQRHYSERTLRQSLLSPSGLEEVERIYYGERRPAYRVLKRLPRSLERMVRPWNSRLSMRFMRLLPGPGGASAVLVKLRKPKPTPQELAPGR